MPSRKFQDDENVRAPLNPFFFLGWDGVKRSFGTTNAVSYRMGSPGIRVTLAEFACDKKKPGGQSSSGQFVASTQTHIHTHIHTSTRVPAPLSRRKAIWKSEPARARAQFPERLGLGNTAAVQPVFLSRGVRKKRRLKINVRRRDCGAQTCHAAGI